MSRIWVFLMFWLAALAVIAFLIPLIAPPGSPDGESLVVSLLILLQLSGLGVAVYAAVLAWRSRKTPRLLAIYALPPFVVMVGFFALPQLMVMTQAIVR